MVGSTISGANGNDATAAHAATVPSSGPYGIARARYESLLHPGRSDSDVIQRAHRPARRPAALLPLYVSFTALQFADVDSTLRARVAGGGQRAR